MMYFWVDEKVVEVTEIEWNGIRNRDLHTYWGKFCLDTGCTEDGLRYAKLDGDNYRWTKHPLSEFPENFILQLMLLGVPI